MTDYITDFEYREDLHLIRLVTGANKMFYVSFDYTVAFKRNSNPETVTVKKGVGTDLASIPSIVPKWIAAKVESHLEAAVVHDYLYKYGTYERETADNIFLAGMEAANVSWWKRQAMFRAVRMFGKSAFAPNQNRPVRPGDDARPPKTGQTRS